MKKTEIENLIKENIKDTALRIYELDNEDRKSLLAEYREWIMNDLDFEEVFESLQHGSYYELKEN